MTKKNRRHGRRKSRRRGGVYYGKGAHKETIDVGCITDDTQTLYHKLNEKKEKEEIASIDLYCIDEKENAKIEALTSEQIAKFIATLKDDNMFVASLLLRNFDRGFIPSLVFGKLTKKTEHLQKEFEDEVSVNIRLNAVYGDSLEKFTAATPFPFDNKKVVGIIVKYKQEEPLYALFSAKCKKIDEHFIDIGKLIEDILASLIALQTSSTPYEHNDIKLDNMVESITSDEPVRYKLIDWGQSDYITDDLPSKIGTRIGTNPIRWYIKQRKSYKNDLLGQPVVAKSHTNFIAFYEMARFGDFRNFSGFIWTNNKIKAEFDMAILNTTPEELYKKFKLSFDVFMLGMTVLHAVFLNGRNQYADQKAKYYKGDNADALYLKYREIIEAFTSLANPLSAVAALKFYRQIKSQRFNATQR